MAAQQPPEGQSRAAQSTMRSDGDRGVLRAGGHEFAAARAERVQRRRKPVAIKSDDSEQQARHGEDVTVV